MSERRRSFLIRDILADVSVDDYRQRCNDELPSTTLMSFSSELSDLGTPSFLCALCSVDSYVRVCTPCVKKTRTPTININI